MQTPIIAQVTNLVETIVWSKQRIAFCRFPCTGIFKPTGMIVKPFYNIAEFGRHCLCKKGTEVLC